MHRTPTAQTSDFALDAACLHGSLASKLKAAGNAGFTQVLLSSRDLVSHPSGLDAAIADVRSCGLKVAGLHGIEDFNGLQGQHRTLKFELAQSMLDLCRAVQAPLLIASTSAGHTLAADGSDLLVDDLRRLAILAVPREVRIAFEPRHAPEDGTLFAGTREILERVDMPNLGICLEADLNLVTEFEDEGEDVGDLVYLVRVADRLPAGGARVFPGEGVEGAAVGEVVKQLERHGCRGPWIFDTNHRDYQSVPVDVVADRAGRSALWLAEDILRRSVPLPHHLLEGRHFPSTSV